MASDTPADAIMAAAEVRLRQYDSEFNASHLSWQDFAAEAREMLEAAAPHIRAEEREAIARLAEQQAIEQDAQHGGSSFAARVLREFAGQIRARTTP